MHKTKVQCVKFLNLTWSRFNIENESSIIFFADIHLVNIFLSFTEAIKAFLTEFCETNENGAKFFKYASQLVNLAHREQVSYKKSALNKIQWCFLWSVIEFL